MSTLIASVLYPNIKKGLQFYHYNEPQLIFTIIEFWVIDGKEMCYIGWEDKNKVEDKVSYPVWMVNDFIHRTKEWIVVE